MKKIIYWAPRVLAILFAMFIMLFSFDVFEGNSSIFEKMIGFLIHNLPVYGIVLVIVLGWKKDIIGVLGFAIIGVLLILLFLNNNPPEGGIVNPAIFIIGGPALLITFLYGLSWKLNK